MSMTPAKLHPRLQADCHWLGRLGDSAVLLHGNAAVPWLILVPDTDALDLLDLPAAQREGLLAQCATLSTYLKQGLGCPRVNFAGIGNLVPQMHLHVVGRREGDPCWPQPVWGHLGGGDEYAEEQVTHWREMLVATAGLAVTSV